MFDQIVGHQQNKEFLARFLKREERPHALLFYGPEGIGKCLLAKEFARAFLCLGSSQGDRPCNQCESCRLLNFETGNFAHPDYLYFDPMTDEEQEKKKTKIISVSQIRSLIKQSAFGPTLSKHGSGQFAAETAGGTAGQMVLYSGGFVGEPSPAHHFIPGDSGAVYAAVCAGNKKSITD